MRSVLPWRCNSGFPLHCCWATKYLILLLTVCLYSYLSYLACKSHLLCVVLYCNLWPVWLYHFFPHFLINDTIFGKMLLCTKRAVWFSLLLLSETFFILTTIQRDITINIHRSSCKVPVIIVIFQWNFNFLDGFSKKSTQISNFMKIRLVGVELFHADRREDMTKLIVAFRNLRTRLKTKVINKKKEKKRPIHCSSRYKPA